MTMPIRVTIWNEHRHERQNPDVARIYPQGIHGALASHLSQFPNLEISTATLDQDPDHGLPQSRLDQTDVLLWWGHLAHADVSDVVVERVIQRVWSGMGLIILHSAHFSKIFKRLMGTTCNLKWRVAAEREILWVTSPGHPILQGITDHFILDPEEMYGEFFDVPEPLETLLISSFSGGEVFRSALTYQRGKGKIFYFRPGHELYPTYHNPTVLQILQNAIHWSAPTPSPTNLTFGNTHPL
jgi:trehalose utilization protein